MADEIEMREGGSKVSSVNICLSCAFGEVQPMTSRAENIDYSFWASLTILPAAQAALGKTHGDICQKQQFDTFHT
jgi:hypothetical protein